jgi:uncharacterized protein YfaQ (DUF2300 family)
MSNNAQFQVVFEVHLPSDTGGSGDTFRRAISVASPDLVDTKEAHKRAAMTARVRLDRWLAKAYPQFVTRMQVSQISCKCIG